jgi:hypothetical protein
VFNDPPPFCRVIRHEMAAPKRSYVDMTPGGTGSAEITPASLAGSVIASPLAAAASA